MPVSSCDNSFYGPNVPYLITRTRSPERLEWSSLLTIFDAFGAIIANGEGVTTFLKTCACCYLTVRLQQMVQCYLSYGFYDKYLGHPSSSALPRPVLFVPACQKCAVLALSGIEHVGCQPFFFHQFCYDCQLKIVSVLFLVMVVTKYITLAV